MKTEQLYTHCLAQGAYYIESEGEAAIIDPLRETQPYIDMAQKNGARIKYILETHFHADFVSGHIDLARETGAEIVYGPTARPGFEATVVEDGAELKLGNVVIKVLHTPGHTLESSTFLLRDENGKDHAIFTGDTLFLGDVGRPDLAQKAANMTREELAGKLYDSLRQKIMPLADDVIVYPGHGAGSACGKNMMQETVDTLGHQKKVNYALRADMTREEFIREVIEGLTPPPGYFPLNARMNREGYEPFGKVLHGGMRALTVRDFEMKAREAGAVILDVRHQDDFVKGFIPGAVFIGLDDNFAPWAGAVIRDVEKPILLVAPENRVEEAVTRLSRVGFDHVLGYLEGGMDAWAKAGKEVDTIPTISAGELAGKLRAGEEVVVDVRRENEFEAGHIEGALNLELDYLHDHYQQVPRKPFYVHCAGGYRSVIAASLMKARGFKDITNIAGGFKAIVKAGIPVTEALTTAKN